MGGKLLILGNFHQQSIFYGYPQVMDKAVSLMQASFSFAINDHYLNHLIRLYQLFEGDFECCIVLGAIAHYGARNFFPQLSEEKVQVNEAITNFRGCNAHSISLSCGIPRENVRRKVKKLQEMGLIEIDVKKQLRVTSLASIELGDFSAETTILFLGLVQRLKDHHHI